MTGDWLSRAVAMVREGYCPNDLGVCLDSAGWCRQCGFRFGLEVPATVVAEFPGDEP